MSWKLLGFISLLWLFLTIGAGATWDWKNLLVYGGIFLTNTGLMFHALH